MPTPAQFTTITTEGGLLPSDLISRLVNDTRSLPGTRDEDYWLTPGRQLREIINRSWNDLLGAWQVFQPQVARLAADDYTAALTRDRWLLPLFAELGYGRLERVPEALTIGDKDYPVSHHHEQAFVHLVGWNVRLDRRTAGVVGAAKAAPHSMLQELLNRTDDHLWAIVSNGRQLRILRDNSSLTRAAYVEFDLEQMFSEGIFTDFVAFWLLVHATRIEGDPQSECWLETWANEARQQGVRALDTLGQGFEDAIAALGRGFLAHSANNTLRQRLRDGNLAVQDFYRQLLRLVYRLVFLLVAEDRSLLHPPDATPEAKERYARYYSVSRVRDLARRRRGTKHSDLWDQILIVARSLGPKGQQLIGLPALNSGLWAAEGTADLDTARLSNTFLLAAVRSLAYTRQDEALHRIDYRNLGSEELGSVYESLLELHPNVDQGGATFSLDRAAGNERKTSGSYYTPTSLISALLESTLDPVLDKAESDAHPELALLNLKILDPACGSGHFLVAAAQRVARRLAILRTGESDPTPDAFRRALRQVIGRCIFGIDLNPMAVELCKVSLWLESVEPGKPLSFLDHHIVCGNSLLGTTPVQVEQGIPDESFKALIGDDKTVVASLKRRNRAERSGQGTFNLSTSSPLTDELSANMMALDELPDDDLEAIATKASAYETMLASDSMARAKFAADAWCAAFVIEKVSGAPELTTAAIRRALETGAASLDSSTVAAVVRLTNDYGFLHPHVAFPQVMGPSSTAALSNDPTESIGFDVLLGNPPWDQIQYDPQEVFSRTHPEIASAPTMTARTRMVASLETDDPPAFQRHLVELRKTEGIQHFIHGSGRFPLSSFGRLNTAPLFAELMRNSASNTGLVGAIVPSGIATDSFNQYLFRDLVEHSLVSLFGFENEEFIFPGVHHATKFCLLTLGGFKDPSAPMTFAFYCRSTEALRDEARVFAFTAREMGLVNPNTHTCPVFRSRKDAEITLGVYDRVPVLRKEGPPETNPWGIQFQLMFMMNTASHLFRTAKECEGEGATLEGNIFQHADGRQWYPLYEGKMVHQFDHRYGTYLGQTVAQANQGTLPNLTDKEHADPAHVVQPRFWVAESDVVGRLSDGLSWHMGFRDITSAVTERTVIATAIPKSAVANNFPLIQSTATPARVALLGASLSSFVLDFVARQKVGGTHLNFFIAEQLPILPPETYDQVAPWNSEVTVADWLRPRVLELTYTARDLEGFASDLEYDGPPFVWDESRRAILRAELDACYFYLYGIERQDVEYIMGTFPVVQRRDESAFGEYRTARLILERYDAMSKAIEDCSRYEGAGE